MLLPRLSVKNSALRPFVKALFPAYLAGFVCVFLLLTGCSKKPAMPANLAGIHWDKDAPSQAIWDSYAGYLKYAEGNKSGVAGKLAGFQPRGIGGVYKSEGIQLVLLQLELPTADAAYGAYSLLVQPRPRLTKPGIPNFGYRAPYFAAQQNTRLVVLYPTKQRTLFYPAARELLTKLVAKYPPSADIPEVLQTEGYPRKLLPASNQVADSLFYFPEGKFFAENEAGYIKTLNGQPPSEGSRPSAGLLDPARNFYGAWYQFGYDFGVIAITNAHTPKGATGIYNKILARAEAVGLTKTKIKLKQPLNGAFIVFENKKTAKYHFVHIYKWLVFVATNASNTKFLETSLRGFYHSMTKHRDEAVGYQDKLRQLFLESKLKN